MNIKYLLIFLFCLSCTSQKRYFEDSGSVFGTLYHIKYQNDKLLTDRIEQEFRDFNLSLNPFNINSIISKVNRNEDIEVDNRFITVFNRAKEIYEASDGAFDPTVAPLINLWGFGFRNFDSISQQQIDSMKSFVGYNRIHLNNRKIIKDDPRIELNFSAIAKGYASDVIAALLESEGVENYMVEIGGEITAKGKNPKGECWHIGINKPEDDSTALKNDYEKIILLCDKKGLATSGNYRNYYIRDGKKYAHTINPQTGYPSEQTILSATVIAPDCMTADAFATAFMVAGVEKAIDISRKFPDLECYFIYSDTISGEYQYFTTN